jgi:hypothetical protein
LKFGNSSLARAPHVRHRRAAEVAENRDAELHTSDSANGVVLPYGGENIHARAFAFAGAQTGLWKHGAAAGLSGAQIRRYQHMSDEICHAGVSLPENQR